MQIVKQKVQLLDGTIQEVTVKKFVPGEEDKIVEAIEDLPRSKGDAIIDHLVAMSETPEDPDPMTEETEADT